MAQTEHLPIYKAAYDLCLYLEQVVHGFSRYHKYSLGADLRDGASALAKNDPGLLGKSDPLGASERARHLDNARSST